MTPAGARTIQERLRRSVRLEPLDAEAVKLVAGADVSYGRHDARLHAAVVVVRLADMAVLDRSVVASRVRFPYVPGLLSFREAPALLEAWKELSARPEALIADGQGLAHPRRFGLACHLGVLLDLPTVGCAKSLLVGEHAPVTPAAGAFSPLVHQGEVVGAAVRTRAGAAPVYVSPGHRVDVDSAVRLVLRCCAGFRMPEPARRAHLVASEARRRAEAGLLGTEDRGRTASG